MSSNSKSAPGIEAASAGTNNSQQSQHQQPQPWQPSVLDEIDAVIFDCDGVLWKEDDLIPGADEVIAHLASLKKTVLFCSNNSGKSRKDYLKKLQKMDLTPPDAHIDIHHFYSSSYAAAHYLLHEGTQQQNGSFNADKESVLVVGGHGITEELHELGITGVIEANEQYGTKHIARNELVHMKLPAAEGKQIGAIIAGIDDQFTYTKCAVATIALTSEHRAQQEPVLFISTNQDRTLPTPGHLLPGGGSVVAMIATASSRNAVNVGKPTPYMLKLALEEHNLKADRVLMVGDRLDTDIQFGSDGGTKTLLVTTTGVNSAKDIPKERIYPTYTADSVADLLKKQ